MRSSIASPMVLIALVNLCAMTVAAQKTFLDSPFNIGILRALKKLGHHFTDTRMSGSRSQRTVKYEDRLQEYHGGPFPCNTSGTRSLEVPKTVHEVRPGDIDVIGALGDSLTAGLAVFATNFLQAAVENRGVTFSGGGQGTWREYLTLPNILKEFNPNLFGYSESTSYTFEKASEFNVAESGAMSKDMPYMARALINRMKKDPRVNLKKHWKMITLTIGANDFCVDMCYFPKPSTILSNHKKELMQVLRSLRDELPRTFVSIVPVPNLRNLVEITGRSSFCELTVDLECPCLFGLAYRGKRQMFYDIMSRWQRLDEEIAQYREFQKDDFAVVIQPWGTNLTFPTTPEGSSDLMYLARDCFHISQKGNARVANALWNNLLQPVGQKSRDWADIFSVFACPTGEKPYIATTKNSRVK